MSKTRRCIACSSFTILPARLGGVHEYVKGVTSDHTKKLVMVSEILKNCN